MFSFVLESAAAGTTGGSVWTIILMYAAVLGIFYLLLIRPQSKKRKKEEELRRNAEVGDEITTIGGIMGKIISIKEETDSVVIESGVDKCRIRIKRWAIGTNNTLHEKEAAKEPEKKGLFSRKSNTVQAAETDNK